VAANRTAPATPTPDSQHTTSSGSGTERMRSALVVRWVAGLGPDEGAPGRGLNAGVRDTDDGRDDQ
jgi:hypothetical protein